MQANVIIQYFTRIQIDDLIFADSYAFFKRVRNCSFET